MSSSNDRHAKKRATMAANLQKKTGRTVDEWVGVVASADFGADERTFKAVADFLKTHHQLGHFQARLVARAYLDRDGHV